MAQFVQRYPEDVYVTTATLIPGRRGMAYKISAVPDLLTEGPIHAQSQINGGFHFNWQSHRIASLVPARATVTVTRNGKFVSQTVKFKARPVEELSTASCT